MSGQTIKVPRTPGPPGVLCYETPPLDGSRGNPMVHCDRKAKHGGRHSWELAVDVERLADELVADLFRNGAGLEGERLAIVAGGIDHGGWSRVGFRDRVIKILSGQVKP